MLLDEHSFRMTNDVLGMTSMPTEQLVLFNTTPTGVLQHHPNWCVSTPP
jgi:hypothetical protein